MVAGNKYLMRVRQFYEPVKKFKYLVFGSHISKITTMHDNISIW